MAAGRVNAVGFQHRINSFPNPTREIHVLCIVKGA